VIEYSEDGKTKIETLYSDAFVVISHDSRKKRKTANESLVPSAKPTKSIQKKPRKKALNTKEK
jgi:hypothetical protein